MQNSKSIETFHPNCDETFRLIKFKSIQKRTRFSKWTTHRSKWLCNPRIPSIDLALGVDIIVMQARDFAQDLCPTDAIIMLLSRPDYRCIAMHAVPPDQLQAGIATAFLLSGSLCDGTIYIANGACDSLCAILSRSANSLGLSFVRLPVNSSPCHCGVQASDVGLKDMQPHCSPRSV